MQILLGSRFYADHWDVGHFWARAFSRLGHSLVMWDWGIDPYPPDTAYDVAVILKGDEKSAEKVRGPKLLYFPDDYARFPAIADKMGLYDKVFTMIRPTPAGSIWLPGAWDPAVHYQRPEVAVRSKATFIGTHTPHKHGILQSICPDAVFGNGWEEQPSWKGTRFFPPLYLHDYARVLSASIVAINVHRVPDIGLTRRIFEFSACTMTISDDVPGVREIFGEALSERMVFQNADEAHHMVARFNADPGYRAETWAMQVKAIDGYTYLDLARTMLEGL